MADQLRPVLLDLFCGAGGAAIGYQRAGFEVVGVDQRDQPGYPGRFYQLDWEDGLELVARHALDQGDVPFVIHASPPCQGYSPHVSSVGAWDRTQGKNEARLIAAVRDAITSYGVPYVIENVMGAAPELHANLFLCGTMFGLPISRHRLFESSAKIEQPFHAPCSGVAARFADAKGWDRRDMTVTGKGRRAGTSDRWREILGWPADVSASQHQLREAIPPAYTELIGRQLMAQAVA
jgi:hypothetical protein